MLSSSARIRLSSRHGRRRKRTPNGWPAEQEGFALSPVAMLDDGGTRFRVGVFYGRPFSECGFAENGRIAVAEA